MKRMAPAQTAQRHPAAAQHPKPRHRLAGVLAAGGRETAGGRQPGRNAALVAAQQQQDGALPPVRHAAPPESRAALRASAAASRRTCSVSSAASAVNSASATLVRGLITIAAPPPNSSEQRLKISRVRRRIRLRTTDPPCLRVTVMPKRVTPPGAAGGKPNTVKWGELRRIPCSYTARNSGRRSRRRAAGQVAVPAGLIPVPGADRNTLASLRPAARQDRSPVLGGHPGAESMGFAAAAPIRL